MSFDGFRTPGRANQPDWGWLNGATDSLVGIIKQREKLGREKAAADALAAGNYDESIRASGDPSYGLRARADQRDGQKSSFENFKSFVDAVRNDPAYKRAEDANSLADKLEAMGDPESMSMAQRLRSRASSAPAALNATFQRYATMFPGVVPKGFSLWPGSASQEADGDATVPIGQSRADTPPASPSGGSVAGSPASPSGAAPAAPAPSAGRAPGGAPGGAFVIPDDPRIQSFDRRQRLATAVGLPDMGKGSIEAAGVKKHTEEAAGFRFGLAKEQEPKIESARAAVMASKEARELATAAQTGALQSRIGQIKGIAERLGYSTTLPADQLLGMVTSRLVLDAAKNMKGALSDKDLAFLERINLSSEWTPQSLIAASHIVEAAGARQAWAASQVYRIAAGGQTPDIDAIMAASHERFPSPVPEVVEGLRASGSAAKRTPAPASTGGGPPMVPGATYRYDPAKGAAVLDPAASRRALIDAERRSPGATGGALSNRGGPRAPEGSRMPEPGAR